MNINKGKVIELNNSLNKLCIELKNNSYTQIELRLNKLKTESITTNEIIKNAQEYFEAVDQSLLKYHAKHMEEINKLINYYWSMTYKGNDIKWIEIRSDVEKTLKSRSYNYRIVFGTSQNSELDMRGRCSAGQKMLASIIIRLALAETFCNSCGILCLDEPTTNLDESHIKALAKSLRDLIQSRVDNNNFQLVVITHDPTFIDMIGSDFCDSFYYVYKNNEGFSTIDVKPISSTFK
jgi:DNA repair protein RAD50